MDDEQLELIVPLDRSRNRPVDTSWSPPRSPFADLLAMLDGMRRTVLCHPSRLEDLQRALDDRQVSGLIRVEASRYITDPSHVYVMDRDVLTDVRTLRVHGA